MTTIVKHKNIYRLVLVAWLLLCGYVLASYLLNPKAGADSEIRVLFYLEMLVLTFPLGFFAGLLASYPVELLSKVGVEMSAYVAQLGTDFLTWLFMVAIGFLQWFVWLPRLLAWIKSMWIKKSEASRQ